MDGPSGTYIRRPLVPGGTNLLGIIKHLTFVELGYFGTVFGRPMGQSNLWIEEGAENNGDLFARADENGDDIIDNYRKACVTSGATFDESDFDSPDTVPW